jgi:NAD(P)-dependent dehydrogenase (short-subunit alcohol dehydrogenase family)
MLHNSLIIQSIKYSTIAYSTYLFYSYWRYILLTKKRGEGKIVAITGAASGVGLETCKYFASHGWKVLAIDINRNGLNDLENYSLANHFNVLTFHMDISNMKSCDQFLEDIMNIDEIKTKGIDALVNCAGLALPGPCLGVAWEKLELQFRVNIIGVIYLTRILTPLLASQNGGNIINISSMAGTIAWPWQGAYSTTKFALEGFAPHDLTTQFAQALAMYYEEKHWQAV